MYQSTKKDNGTYSKLAFLIRGVELCSPSMLNRYISDFRACGRSLPNKVSVFIEYYLSLIILGAIIPDYFEYQFWEKSFFERRNYITMARNKKIKKKFNDEPIGVFRNKLLFNHVFKEFRPLLCFDFKTDSGEKFWKFCQVCDGTIIVKPLTGDSGRGIHKRTILTLAESQNSYDELKSSGEYFCEEVFVQDGIIHEICPASCNTIRIYTIVINGVSKITSANIRFGNGERCVDNIHGGGMCCEVDLNLGMITGPGRDLSGNIYYEHPESRISIPGIQIPRWEEICEMIKEAALVVPNQGHVAWDVAVSSNKIAIIEGNDGGNFDLPQVASQRGMWPEYKDYLRTAKLNKA